MTIEYLDSKRIVKLSTDKVETVTEETLDSTNGTASWNVTNGGSDITIDTGNNEIDITGTGQKSGYYDLGASVSASAWTLRFKIASSGSPTGNPLFWVGLFDVNTIDSRNTNVDGISLMMYTGSNYLLSMKNGTHMDSGGTQTLTSPTVSADTTTRYVEIVRDGSNAILTFYDSDTYTTSIGTCTVAITGTSFQYLCAASYFEGSGRTYSLSNVKFYNGVSSLSSKPTNVQDNSILVEKDTGNRYWSSTTVKLSSLGSTFEQASNNDSRTFGVSGRTALGVKLSAGHFLVGKTVRTFSVIVNQDPSGAGDIKAYVIRSGYGSNDQVAESTASTLPTGTGNTTFNITFTFSSDVSILANDIIAFTNVGMTSMSSAKTSSSDIDPNAEALCVVSGTAFTFSDFVTMSGTYNNLAYRTTPTNGTSTFFTNAGGGDVKVSSDLLSYDCGSGGTSDSRSYYDLGTDVSESAWVLRFKMTSTVVSNSASSCHLGFGLSSITSAWDINGNALVFVRGAGTNANDNQYYLSKAVTGGFVDNGNANKAGFATSTGNVTNQVYYVELKRTSATTVVATIFSDAYVTSVESETFTNLSGLTGLRYLKCASRSQNTNTNNGTIDDVIFYNGVTTPIPTAWTLNPTFEDDFSTYTTQALADATWATNDTTRMRVNISTDVFDFTSTRNGSAATSYHTLSKTASNDKWLLRFRYNMSSSNNNDARLFIGLSSTTGNYGSTEDWLGIIIPSGTGHNLWAITDYNNAATTIGSYSSFALNPVTGTNYYVELIRVSSTSFKLNLYSDSGYSTLINSVTHTMLATVDGLSHLKIMNMNNDSAGYSMTGIIDDVLFYNGVSSL